jgi:putative phage-type endonuclease
MEQRSPEWFAARLGKVTASRVADIIAKTKSGYSTSRAKYMAELVCERLTGRSGDFFQSAAMLWGTEKEPMARSEYELHTGSLVSETGLVFHSSIPDAAASPDGLIDDDGLVEIKCPTSGTHIDTLMGQAIPAQYVPQMMWQMACTGRQWCDFVSYDPRMPEHMQLFVARLDRDENVITELEREVEKFLSELDEKMTTLSNIYEKEAE